MISSRFVRTLGLLVFILMPAAVGLAQAEGSNKGLTRRERALHAVSRLTFGAKPGLVEEVERIGVEAWLEQQFQRIQPDGELKARMSVLESIDLTAKEVYDAFDLPAAANETPAQRQARSVRREKPIQELPASVMWRAVDNSAQVAEVMAEFWRNHLNVDAGKDGVGLYVGEYDRLVIRQNVFGSFADLLMASAKHPAMLIYLDNAVSRRPPSKTELKNIARSVERETGSKERGQEALRIAAQNGLNENYARELMELHTLGVDNGYTQKDVIALAEALTGWTVDNVRRSFHYEDDVHVPGDKFVLGKTVSREKRRNGMAEAEQVIELLASHPGTADYLAKKLCTYYVADDPPAALVERTARELKKTRFDAKAALRVIVGSEEFFDRRHYRTKFRTPFEYVAAAVRASGAEVNDPSVLVRVVADMGQKIYGCEDPTGYRDVAESWRDPGVMVARWRFALELAANRVPGVTIPDAFFAEFAGKSVPALIDGMARRILPAGLRHKTIAALMQLAVEHARVEAQGAGDPKAPKNNVSIERRLLGVLIGSPEFQEQ